MSVVGVKALLLAATTAATATALPFTPPAGWTQLPSSAIRTVVKNVWQGPPSTNGAQSFFSEMLTPFPFPSLSKGAKVVHLCGLPGELQTRDAGIGAQRRLTQIETVSKYGFSYMITYSRPADTPADPHIETVMRTFCPSVNGEIATLQPPSGWIAKGSMNVVGMWMGSAPMQMMMLSKGPQMSSLTDVLQQALSPTKNAATGELQVSSKAGTQCGLPALYVTMSPNVPAFPMTIESVVTQGDGSSYMLTYLHPSDRATDKAALASMQTLCAVPNASPSPTASPQASATPLRRE